VPVLLGPAALMSGRWRRAIGLDFRGLRTLRFRDLEHCK
jgi:hypothetical protein